MRRPFATVAVVLFGLLFLQISIAYVPRETLPPLAQNYMERGPAEVGAPNVITGILLRYRGFDTLGEVAVLFMVAAGVGLVLRGRETAAPPSGDESTHMHASELVRSGANILMPLILIFAAYIIMNGHLSAGGGFQGGAVVASAAMLFLLARRHSALDQAVLSLVESLAGVLFVLVGVAGLFLAGGFLDNRVLPLGEFGAFFSAGTIPIISVLLGVKVGAELSVIVDRFRT